ncbi:MAG: hypothetical protein IRY83_05225 [Chloroflexi bacterium]|nr:hypothetical protein [Chloroflexota bacterium]
MHWPRAIHLPAALLVSLVTIVLLALAAAPAPVRAGARTWSKLDLDGIRVNALAVDPTNPRILFAGTNGNGIFRSTDGGNSWSAVNAGLGNPIVNALSIDPTAPTTVLAGTGRGPLVGEPTAGVYRTTNRGDSWAAALTNATSSALARAPRDPRILYSAGAGVFRSTDGGASWTRLVPPPTSAIRDISITGIAVSPIDANLVIAVGNTEGGTGRIFRSADGGMSWTFVQGGLPPVFDVAFSPSGLTILVAVQTGILRSTDGGFTFQRVSEELGTIEVRRVLFNPLNPDQAFAATDRGVFQGLNNAANWSQLDTTLGSLSVRALAIDQASPQTLYAGTDNGVWAFTFAQPVPPPTPTVSWFFAEGSTQPPFDTWFLVQNPTGRPATVTFTFQIQGGGSTSRTFTVGPTSRFSLFVNQILPNQAFSTRIDSTEPVRAERAMFVSFDGDAVAGIPAPRQTWLFAEGSTQPPFHTWLLLQNPNSAPATATITYFLLGGGPPRRQTIGLPPLSRTSIFVNQVLPNQAFSSRVDSDQPIVVERAQYRFPGNAATADAGLNQPATSFFFPVARTGLAFGLFRVPFDAFLLLANPNLTPATVTVTLFRANGQVVSMPRVLAPTSRQNIFLNAIIPNGIFGIRVEANQPILAERSLFFGPEPRGAMAIFGSTELATEWFLAEGSTQPPFTEVISILNPNSATMAVHIDFELPGGQVIGRDFQIGPTRPLEINVNAQVPGTPVSAHITTSLPSVVERQMFLQKLGALGGTDALAVR